jgi:hypothetical protein
LRVVALQEVWIRRRGVRGGKVRGFHEDRTCWRLNGRGIQDERVKATTRESMERRGIPPCPACCGGRP